MLKIRTMTLDDIPAGMYLKNQAGWNQTPSDWRRFIHLQPDGCFVGELDGRIVATTSVCVLDAVGWIGMVLVEEPMRRQGIGSKMVEHSLKYLDDRGVQTARLDATPAGLCIYERFEFSVDYEILRMEGVASPQKIDDWVVGVNPERLGDVCRFDREVRGMNRYRLLESLHAQSPQGMQAVFSNGDVSGYVSYRTGMVATQIGPSVVRNDEIGAALADAALARCAGQRVFMDIPAENDSAIRWAQSRGLKVQRPLMRMHRGQPVGDNPKLQWASSGPEKG